MVNRHESDESQSMSAYDEAAVDRLVDTNSVSSYDEAFRRLGIEIPLSETDITKSIATALTSGEETAADEPHAVTPDRKKRSPRIRRAGREPRHGDSELDGGTPSYYLPYEPSTPEDIEKARETAQRGRAEIMRATAVQRYDRLIEDAKKLGIPPAALLRAREEKRNRNR